MNNFIDFKNVGFAYKDGSKVFDGLDLQIAKGQKVGIVGHSGAGKSTLINLLLKNFAITNYKHWDSPTKTPYLNLADEERTYRSENKMDGGDIVINGQSIYDVSSDSLRSNIALIPQDTMLFHRTIGENIGYAKEGASAREIENAAKSANIHEFIASLPSKYDTLVGERGIKLSGGQRQRIAIARAILKNAPILILDEATSALDSATEGEIQKSINAMLEANNATVIAIAHRLSTIKHMDRIIVMDDGLVMEDGSFEELLTKDGGRFKAMWQAQVNGMLV
jgi:ATP-binding cassette subfamily B protein